MLVPPSRPLRIKNICKHLKQGLKSFTRSSSFFSPKKTVCSQVDNSSKNKAHSKALLSSHSYVLKTDTRRRYCKLYYLRYFIFTRQTKYFFANKTFLSNVRWRQHTICQKWMREFQEVQHKILYNVMQIIYPWNTCIINNIPDKLSTYQGILSYANIYFPLTFWVKKTLVKKSIMGRNVFYD